MNLPTPERDRDPRHPLPSTRVYLFEIRGDRKAGQLGLLFQSWTFNLSNRDFTHSLRLFTLFTGEHVGKDQGGDNRGIRFDDIFRCLDGKLAPGNLLIGYCPGVRAIACGRIADLAKIAPAGHVEHAQILFQHGYDTDREIASDSPTDLEEADGMILDGLLIPPGEYHHVLDTRAHGMDMLDIALEAMGRVDVPQGRIFPAGYKDRQAPLAGRYQPTILRINLIIGLEIPVADDPVHELMRKISLSLAIGGGPFLDDRRLDAPYGFVFGNAGIGNSV